MRRFFLGVGIGVGLFVLVVAVRMATFAAPGPYEHRAQLRYLRRALDAGAGDRMQRIFPEGDFFTHVLYGLAWTNLAAADSTLRDEAVREASWALAQLERPASRDVFPVYQDPPYGVFFTGWTAWLRGHLLAITPPAERRPADTTELRRRCDELAAAFGRRPFPTSYPGASWPPDGSSGIAALALYDRLFGPRYASTIERWLAQTDTLRIPPTGLFPHTVDGETQRAALGPRASSAVAIVRAMADVEPRRAQADWTTTKAQFLRTRFGLHGMQEYPDGVPGQGDIDAGPLIFGVSASATVYAIASARAMGDTLTARRLDRVAEAVGMPVAWRGTRRYLFGALPVGDAFLVWARTTPMPIR